jgi:hypothetical protein
MTIYNSITRCNLAHGLTCWVHAQMITASNPTASELIYLLLANCKYVTRITAAKSYFREEFVEYSHSFHPLPHL